MSFQKFSTSLREFLIAYSFLFLSTPSVFAKDTGFTDHQKGLVLGLGTYFHPLKNDNQFDPVPSLAQTGTTTAGSNKTYLLPLKMGIFVSRGMAEVEGYFRYMINTHHKWTTTGDVAGDGYTKFKSYGAGANLGVSLAQTQRAQIKFVLNGEYVLQKANLSFANNGTAEYLDLKSSTLLAGFGFQPELWLGDLWVLSLFAGYQYGLLRNWKVSEASNFMGAARSAGTLTNANGSPAPSQFGGILVEISFKLNFYE